MTTLHVIALATLLALGACVSQPSTYDPRQVWCDTNTPRRDATPETPRDVIDRINTHNDIGVKWCGWTP